MTNCFLVSFLEGFQIKISALLNEMYHWDFHWLINKIIKTAETKQRISTETFAFQNLPFI